MMRKRTKGSNVAAVLRILFYRGFVFVKPTLVCFAAVGRKFFGLQYWAAASGKIPISQADHPLDEKIPFDTSWARIYMDFSTFWIRTLAKILALFGKTEKAEETREEARAFFAAVTRLYFFTGGLYGKHLSTTRRPARFWPPQFITIHLLDPHLMCIPSLHVELMILAYTRFRAGVEKLGGAEKYAKEIAEVEDGAIGITESVLFVKQHSINCVAAAMYAMTRFDAELFPPEEAERFCSRLFIDSLPKDSGEAVRNYMLELYRRFYDEGKNLDGDQWDEPLLAFLRAQPKTTRRWN